MKKMILLAKNPDLVLKLEKYDLIPPLKKGGAYEGCAKKWAKEKKTPYDKPEFQALAERLPPGWEELDEEEMNRLLTQLKEKIDNKKQAELDIPNKGSEKMLKNLTHFAFLAISTLSALLVEQGIGLLPAKEEKEEQYAREFSFELMLHLINGTDFLTRIFRSIAQTTNTSQKNQELIGEVLKIIAIYTAMQIASNSSPEKMDYYFTNFKHVFYKGIKNIQAFISEKVTDGTLNGDSTERVALSLQQMHIALSKQDYSGFYEGIVGIFQTAGLSIERFMADIKEMRNYASNLHCLIDVCLDYESHQKTVVSQAM